MEEEWDSEQETMQNVIEDLIDDEGSDTTTIKEALAQYEEDYGQDIFWKFAWFHVYEIDERPEDMLKILNSIDEQEADADLLNTSYARAYFANGMFQKAMDSLEQVDDAVDTEDALKVINMKAFINMGLGEFAKAASCFEDLMLELPEPQLMAACGLCYIKLGKRERAKEYLERACSSLEHWDDNWLVGLICSLKLPEQIDFDDPIIPRNLKKAVERYLDQEEGYYPIPMNMLEDAIAEDPVSYLPFIQEELRKNKDSHMTNYLTAICYEKLGDEKSARKYLRKTLVLPLDEQGKQLAYDDQVSLKLMALYRLKYSPKVNENHLVSIFHECQNNPESVANVFLYCRMIENYKVLGYIYDNYDGWDIPFFDDEHLNSSVNDALITLYNERGEYEKSLPLLETMLADRHDLHFLSVYAYTLAVAGQPFPSFYQEKPEGPRPWEFIFALLYLLFRFSIYEVDTSEDFYSVLAGAISRMLYDQEHEKDSADWSILAGFAVAFEEEIRQLLALNVSTSREQRDVVELFLSTLSKAHENTE
jgi:tetratricopeptide (TPR) repeat protein